MTKPARVPLETDVPRLVVPGCRTHILDEQHLITNFVEDAFIHGPTREEKTISARAQPFCLTLLNVGRGIVCWICYSRIGNRFCGAKAEGATGDCFPVEIAVSGLHQAARPR